VIKLVQPEQKEIIYQIVKLESASFGVGGLNEWTLMPLIRHGRVFYIEENDMLLACAQYMLDWNNHYKAYLVGLSVKEEMRGKGLGTLLLKETLQILSEENIISVELTVDPQNKAAISVYDRKLGFVIVGQLADEYGKGINRIVMKKTL